MKKLLFAVAAFMMLSSSVMAEGFLRANHAGTVVIVLGATSTPGNVVVGLTYRVICDQDAHINDGADATTSTTRLAANQPELFEMTATTVEVIQEDTAGSCWFTPVF